MEELADVTVTLLASRVLLYLGWLVLGRILTPEGTLRLPVTIQVFCHGEGEGMEETLRALLWLRDRGLGGCRILLVDEGLTERGRRVAKLLCRRWHQVELADPQRASEEEGDGHT